MSHLYFDNFFIKCIVKKILCLENRLKLDLKLNNKLIQKTRLQKQLLKLICKETNIFKTYIISVIILRIDEKNNITDLVSEVKYLNFIIELVFDESSKSKNRYFL